MYDITLSVDHPDVMEQWVSIGQMLSVAIQVPTKARPLNVCVRPNCTEHACSMSDWLRRMVLLLNKALPAPYYPPNPEPSQPYEGIYDLTLVALNARESNWRLVLDLQDQTNVLDIGPMQTLLLSELHNILYEQTEAALVKREWIMQLFEGGNIDIQIPECVIKDNRPLLDAVVSASRTLLEGVLKEEILRPVARRMALEYGLPPPDANAIKQMAEDVVRRAVRQELNPV